MAIRPLLTSSQRWMLSAGVLSVIGSIVDRGGRMPAEQIRALLAEAASAILAAELPGPEEVLPRPVASRVFAADAGAYEALLHAAMVLFKERGYSETSMAQIASAAGIPVSGIYRYFSGQVGDCSDRIAPRGRIRPTLADPGRAHRTAGRVDRADRRLRGDVVRQPRTARGLSHRASESAARRPAAMLLHNAQRSTIDSWVRLLTAARPSLLVVDLGRMASPQIRHVSRRVCES
nr:helix-turn-helix domain-containing protein [Mycobacterium lacus]